MVKRQRLLPVLSVAVSISLVAFLVARLDGSQARVLLSQARAQWLLAALACIATVPLAAITRWTGVLRAQGTPVPFGIAARAVFLANLLNAFLPAKAGELAKLGWMRGRIGLAVSLGAVVLERLVDLTVLGLLALVGSVVAGVPRATLAGALLLILVGAAVLLILFLPVKRAGRWEGGILQARSVFTGWIGDPVAVLRTVGGSCAVWLLSGLVVVCLCRALAVDIGSAWVLAVYPVGVLAGLVPVSISGIGPRDAVLVQLLLAGGAGRDAATLVAFGYTVFAYWILALIGLPFLAGVIRQRPGEEETS